MPADNKDKVTILKLRKQKQNNVKTVGVTAYDYPQALMADNAGVDWILVGDSLGMTTLGYKSTIPVTMDDMLRSARAVARGSSRAFTVGDLPYMSYQVSNEEAVRNAGDFIQAGMDAVKVEGCMVERVKAICDAGIMVMSHLGLTPHTRAKIILDQALRLQDAGCTFLLLEGMPRESAEMIATNLEIPVYGIGAGDKVDGQLVIMHDLVGLFWEFKSKFVKRYCEAGQMIQSALTEYVNEVRDLQFPSQENFYEIKDEELEKLLGQGAGWKHDK